MAINGNTAKGIAIGVGLTLLAPVALAGLAGFGRPAARAAAKAGLLVYEKGLETAAELGEIFEDLIAEAQAERYTQVDEVQEATEAPAEAATAKTSRKPKMSSKKRAAREGSSA